MQTPAKVTVIVRTPSRWKPSQGPQGLLPTTLGAPGSSQRCLLGHLGPQMPGRLEAEHFLICVTWGWGEGDRSSWQKGPHHPSESIPTVHTQSRSQRPRKNTAPTSRVPAWTSTESCEGQVRVGVGRAPRPRAQAVSHRPRGAASPRKHRGQRSLLECRYHKGHFVPGYGLLSPPVSIHGNYPP